MHLLASFIVIFFALSAGFGYAQTAGTTPLTLEQFKEALPLDDARELDLQGFLDLQNEGPVTVLDVRSEKSFAQRHLKGSVNAPLTELTEKTLPALIPDKNMPVVLACDYSFQPVRTIAMTLQAYPVLKAAGYTKIYRLNLWQAADGKNMLSNEEQEKRLPFETAAEEPPVMCTMDAKACPDGSFVSRTGPHCEFAPCP